MYRSCRIKNPSLSDPEALVPKHRSLLSRALGGSVRQQGTDQIVRR